MSDGIDRRRRYDRVIACCKALAVAVLPLLAHLAAQALESWARHHQAGGTS